MSRVKIVTTMWDILPDHALGEARIADLQQNFWADLLTHGAQHVPLINQSKEAALKVVAPIINATKELQARRADVTHEATVDVIDTLRLQKEVVDYGLANSETSAGRIVAAKLQSLIIAQRERLEALQATVISEDDEDPARLLQQLDEIQRLKDELTVAVDDAKRMKMSLPRKMRKLFYSLRRGSRPGSVAHT